MGVSVLDKEENEHGANAHSDSGRRERQRQLSGGILARSNIESSRTDSKVGEKEARAKRNRRRIEPER